MGSIITWVNSPCWLSPKFSRSKTWQGSPISPIFLSSNQPLSYWWLCCSLFQPSCVCWKLRVWGRDIICDATVREWRVTYIPRTLHRIGCCLFLQETPYKGETNGNLNRSLWDLLLIFSRIISEKSPTILLVIFPGNVVIVRSFSNFKEGNCDKTLYLFAIVSTIVTYALVFVLRCASVQEEDESNDVPVWRKRKPSRSQSVLLVDLMTSSMF